MLATGLPEGQVDRRLDLAVDEDGRARVLHAALARGRVSVDRAVRIHQDTRGLGVEEVHAICERLLAPNRDGSLRTERAFRRELRRQVAVHTPDPQQPATTPSRTAPPTPHSTRCGTGRRTGCRVPGR